MHAVEVTRPSSLGKPSFFFSSSDDPSPPTLLLIDGKKNTRCCSIYERGDASRGFYSGLDASGGNAVDSAGILRTYLRE